MLLKAALVVVSLALMSSVGGLFVLALLLLPFHWLAARSASMPGRLPWAGLAGGIVALNIWAAYFALFKESQPLVWLVPTLSFALTATAFIKLPREPTPAA